MKHSLPCRALRKRPMKLGTTVILMVSAVLFSVLVKRGELFKIDLQLIQDNQKRHNGELFKIKSAVV